jgi:hypothetical protein
MLEPGLIIHVSACRKLRIHRVVTQTHQHTLAPMSTEELAIAAAL